jgi:hypothetical protein
MLGVLDLGVDNWKNNNKEHGMPGTISGQITSHLSVIS